MNQVTGATVPLIIGEYEYQASSLTDRDNDELDNWLKHYIVRTAKDLVKDEEDHAFRKDFIEVAHEKSLVASFHNHIGIQIFGTSTGIARIAWQMIKKNHPKVTHEELIPRMREEGNIENVHQVFQELHPERFAERNGDSAKNDQT
jgi:hypothetical protein